MNRRSVQLFLFMALALMSSPLRAQETTSTTSQSPSDLSGIQRPALIPLYATLAPQPESSLQEGAPPGGNDAPTTSLGLPADSRDSKKKSASDSPLKIGSITVFGNWRFRTEGWDWFQPTTGENAYAFPHSLLFLGVSQKTRRFEWLIEGAQDAIVGLPNNAIGPGRQGQLGLGGTYFVANGNSENNASAFLKQAYLGVKFSSNGEVRVGRFGFSDGMEVKPKDKTIADLVNTRIAQRLIGEFTFSAVQRSFDGAQLALDAGKGNFTFLAVRPTEGVYQVDAMGELNVNLFYGAYTLPTSFSNSKGELRIFAIGYLDERGGILKTDNRSVAARTADTQHIQIGTYGADYVHVFHTDERGQFDFLLWGALQNGSWGVQTQRAGSFVGEFGWQPPVQSIKPWLSVGYSFGSGDSNPNDNTHGTFFQILPTPRLYARFPFYNMENNEDFYGSAVFHLPHSVAIRSELHAMRLASAQDLWYLGGGAYQESTFGYVGRTSGGSRSLASTWDISSDYQMTGNFSIGLYYAHAWGKAVLASIYPKNPNAQFAYIETNLRF